MSKGYEYVDLERYESSDMDSAVAAVWMLLNTPVNEGKIVTVVEGQDDVEFYSRFFVSDSTMMYPDGNCDKHAKILTALNSEYGSRIVAIKDADFDRLNNVKYNIDNLFLTDAHDMEGMVLSKGIPESFVSKYDNLLSGGELDVVLSDLKSISYLKWFNSQQTERLKFKGVPLNKFYEPTFCIDICAFIENAKKNTNNVIHWTLQDVKLFEQKNNAIDFKQLYRGHDVFECIYIRAHKAAKGHNLPKTLFAHDLRLSYGIKDFIESKLYLSLKQWAANVGIELLVA